MSDNNDSNNSKKNRSNKKSYYKSERESILNDLINIIKFNDDNSILLDELYNNINLIDKINSIKDDIKKYYRCSTWGYFTSITNGKKGDEITLLRSIFKDHDYIIFSKDVVTEYNSVKKRYTKLFFNK